MNQSKQSKFPLGLVVNLLTAVAFGYICFLSANFYTLGDKTDSITLAIIITFLLSGTSLGAKFLKQTKRNFKSRFIWEIILLVLFTVFTAYFTYFPFSHYLGVKEKQKKIQCELNTSIMQAEKMFTEYERYVSERKSDYESNLRSAVLTMNASDEDFRKYGFVRNSISYNEQINTKMTTIDFDLLPSNFEQMKKDNTEWLANSKRSVNDWKAIGLVDVTNNVEQNSKDWKSKLIKLSEIREIGEKREVFKYKLDGFNGVQKYFTTHSNPTPVSIGLSIVAYLLMLVSYVLTTRSTRSSFGFRALFSKKTSGFDIEF